MGFNAGGHSACASSGRPRRLRIGRASRRSASSTHSNSGTPEGDRKHLKPGAPASASASRSPALPGTTPPQHATSTCASRAANRLASNAQSVVVAGTLLSGMSTIVVMPPAAAALVAVSKPSHSVRPGSFTCTWVSTRPGMTTRSPTSWTCSDGACPAQAAAEAGGRASEVGGWATTRSMRVSRT